MNGQLFLASKAKALTLALFVSLFVLFVFPVATHAQAVPPADTTTEAPADDTTSQGDEEPAPTVEAPGEPVATSPTDERDIVWEWAPPEGGLTPDAPVVEPVEPVVPTDPAEPTHQAEVEVPPETPVAEHPTDITHYGYELSDGDIIVDAGTVESTVTTATTKVINTGSYAFRLWSITRDTQVSNSVFGYITIVNSTPVLPSYPPIEIPVLIGATPSTDIPTISQVVSNTLTYYTAVASTVISSDESTTNANVLSDTDTASPVSQAGVTAAVVPSSQGWVIAGLPWYVWLLIVAIIFTAWRWFAMVAKNK
jgi:hypothetical protein